jgi:hypothetical protein
MKRVPHVKNAREQTWDSELKKLIRQKWKQGQVFGLAEVYQFEEHFGRLYPDNANVPDKLRQAMQHLRDDGFVEFVDDKGTYRRSSA